jgi:UDP-N-acetylmuramate dehydrogenase
VLGDGSNVLFRGDFPGMVLRVEARRVETVGRDALGTLVRVEAGHGWHAFVEWTLSQGLVGIENLALIPGTVGAAPIQNIGAYGAELDALVESVEVYDRSTSQLVDLDRAACAFDYRNSLFKRAEGAQRYIITAVRFRFAHDRPLVLHYPGVREELAALGMSAPTAADVARAVCAIRRRKLPDPARIGNAGSFFKNPQVPVAQAEALAARLPALPVFAARDPAQRKLSAGWLIENLGLRGYRDGDAGVAESHALVLVNHGEATGEQIWRLAQFIQERVAGAYGVMLEPEPVVV